MKVKRNIMPAFLCWEDMLQVFTWKTKRISCFGTSYFSMLYQANIISFRVVEVRRVSPPLGVHNV